MKKVCRYHFYRHCRGDDSFSLFDIFGIPKMKLAVDSGGFDKLGRPLPKDAAEMPALIEKHRKLEGLPKKEDSIERLKRWKAENGNRKRKRKRRPPPPRPSKRERQEEFDSIVNDILGD
jgi:hypothetical protein